VSCVSARHLVNASVAAVTAAILLGKVFLAMTFKADTRPPLFWGAAGIEMMHD